MSGFLVSALNRALQYTNGTVSVGVFFSFFSFLAPDFEESLENDYAVSSFQGIFGSGCLDA